MSNLKSLKNDQESVESMNLLVHAYQEISVMRMQKIRSNVIKTRDFMEQLSAVFHDVKHAYKKLVEALNKSHKKHGDLAFQTGKRAVVLLTPNTKLYGSIMNVVFNAFMKYVRAHPDDQVVIVGKLGLELYREQGGKKEDAYFELPSTTLTIEDIKPVMFHLAGFEDINVFHGKFQSLLTQSPAVSNITGEDSAEFIASDTTNHQDDNKEFFFEPSLEEVLLLFRDQIIGSLLNQTFSESELAQHASRIQSMENASSNISKALSRMGRGILKEKKRVENKKQLEQFVSIISYH